MKKWLIILILIISQASATVEDMGTGSVGGPTAVWPGSMSPTSTSMPMTSMPATAMPVSSACPTCCLAPQGNLIVSVSLTGPISESDSHYTTPGKTTDYVVSVKNEGVSEVDANISINPEKCNIDWFSWTSKTMKIPAGVSRSESFTITPDMSALAGDYCFLVEASAKCRNPGSDSESFKIQAFDYASETVISGTGQFQINKDIRSMDSGIKSNKDITFSGSVDALVKNEYLVDRAKGRNPNFEEQDAVDNYNALKPGDALFGTEAFKSSAVFGGVGAKVLESYNVQRMEFKNQDFNLHQTGSLKKMAEFKTADNFTGFYLLDAKQVLPGQKSLKEHEEYWGSFEINRRILFRDNRPSSGRSCFGDSCDKSNKQPIAISNPCFSSSCDNFMKRLDAFSRSS
jgi:hypothetical protein